jgi:peptidoglycan/xylan/chitin deacetylase (PgdA/CDA1 family)
VPDLPIRTALCGVVAVVGVLGVSASCTPAKRALTPAPPAHLELADVSSLAIDAPVGRIQLHDGHAELGDGGASKDRYSLSGVFAEGDINGDGRPDAAVVLVDDSAGSGVFFSLVAVVNSANGLQAQKPFDLGDRIVVQQMGIERGTIHLTMLDRSSNAASFEVDQQRMMSLAYQGDRISETAHRITPLAGVPLPPSDAAVQRVKFEQGGSSARVSGNIRYGQRQGYEVDATAGQLVHAELSAPLGLFLTVQDHAGHPLTQPTDRTTALDVPLRTSGSLRLVVVSLNGDHAAYSLHISIDSKSGSPSSTPTGSGASPTKPTPAAGSKVLYLTFDDGPSTPYTQQVLKVLAKFRAHATFFDLGQQAQRYPELLAAELAGGNTIGNHTWDHRSLAGMSRAKFNNEVMRTKTVLGVKASKCLRPPYGAHDGFTADYAAALGYRLQYWDIDTRDWARPGVNSIVTTVLTGARNGSVVLMHDGGGDRTQSVDALEKILSTLSSRGWQFPALC